ncbi:hypothetical protein [Methylobacterium oryzisoli]|uniref:hypothetical protein n=1 Tax=Methylobacterium oryzisoli TaxID=3385502 RepID=UPI003892853A
MAKAVSIASSTIWRVVFPAGLILLAFLNFASVNQAFRDLLSVTARIQSMKTVWGELVLKDRDRLTVSLQKAGLDRLPPQERQAIIGAIGRLTGMQTLRLFTLPDRGIHCVYDRPSPDLRLYAVTDVDLEHHGLVSSSHDDDTRRRKTDEERQPDDGNGLVQSCHRLSLTERGLNVKTALLGIIRDEFDGGVAIAAEKP